MPYLPDVTVIEHFGGTPPDLVDYPKNYDPNKKRGEKSHANGVRAHNESRAFDTIRALLRRMGRFDVRENTSYGDILRIGVFMWFVPSERSCMN